MSERTSSVIIQNAKVNNLKNLSVNIPINTLTVVTGLSGSGKSSLAFDTLYAEGQRRYVESMSSYARQFMGKISKPEVESIKGLPPAIAIEQKTISRNLRSTVGTTTEIYDYLKLLFARVGKTYSPVSGAEVQCHTIKDVSVVLNRCKKTDKIHLFAAFKRHPNRTTEEQLRFFLKQGYSRVLIQGELQDIAGILKDTSKLDEKEDLFLFIDRFKGDSVQTEQARINESLEMAFSMGKGDILVQIEDRFQPFCNRFEADGMSFEMPSVNLFSFNNPYGACPTCNGSGVAEGIDADLVIPDKSLSVFENAVVCWNGEKSSRWKEQFILTAKYADFPLHRAVEDLTEAQFDVLWKGTSKIKGVLDYFSWIQTEIYKIQNRVILSRYTGKTICPDCKGKRLRAEADYVKINGKSINDLVEMPISELSGFFSNLHFETENEQKISKLPVQEILNRLEYLSKVGLEYLTLNRASRTLSGGESQRISLAATLGSCLVGSLYILDEPSIGLHPRDTHRLIEVLKQLRDIGNTVVVVEHDRDIIQAADYIIDIGPMAGRLGGELVFSGNYSKLLKQKESITAKYLNGTLKIEIPKSRRISRKFIQISGAREHNLKQLTVRFPLNVMTVVTGVSGSGKTTLVKNILYPALQKQLQGQCEIKAGRYSELSGDLNAVHEVAMVDQNPIGRSSRSNPATYLKAFDDIRQLFADEPLAKIRGYKPGFFSFNVEGGRCEHCEGEGYIAVSMQFMADVKLLCKECKGKRYKDEVLDVKVNGINISEILDMTVLQAIDFFEALTNRKTAASIVKKLKPLQQVGLGYLKLGQSSSTLSGGEAQRIKLAYFLALGASQKPTLFIFDEPTTGLHFHDIHLLYESFNRLIENGHSMIIIEHNPDMIKCADWIIDLGKEGGDAGGHLIFEGTPEDLIQSENGYTAQYVRL